MGEVGGGEYLVVYITARPLSSREPYVTVIGLPRKKNGEWSKAERNLFNFEDHGEVIEP